MLGISKDRFLRFDRFTNNNSITYFLIDGFEPLLKFEGFQRTNGICANKGPAFEKHSSSCRDHK